MKLAAINILVLSSALTLGMVARAQNAPAPASIVVDTQTADWQVLDACKGNRVLIDPNVDWRSFRRVQFAPTSYAPVEGRKQLSHGDAQKMTAVLDASLRSAYRMQPDIDGPVLLIRPFITNIKRTNTPINVISFAAIQMAASYGAASVRYELMDAGSGRHIGEITSQRSARPWNVYPWNVLENFRATGQSSVLLKSDAKKLKKDTDLLGKIPTATKVALVANRN